MSYSKLFSSIVTSSIWTESDSTRVLFITLLALADRNGFVYGSKTGLGRIACLNLDAVDEAFAKLLGPDPDSSDRFRNPDNEGRRLEQIDGGFKLINYEYYRGIRNDDDRKVQNREAQRRFRERQRASADVSQDQPQSPHTDAEAEADTENI